MSLNNLNKTYLQYLSTYPLLTKAVTAGVFLGLNETVASIWTNQFKETELPLINKKIKHVFSKKLLYMIIYGSMIATPIAHNMYKHINRVFKPPLAPSRKLLQILVSLSTVTPLLSALYTGFIGLVGQYKPNWEKNGFEGEFVQVYQIIKRTLQKNYFLILRTSLVTSLVSLVIAQKFIDPELWVVFFNFVVFITGTYQNIRMKKIQATLDSRKSDEVKKEE